MAISVHNIAMCMLLRRLLCRSVCNPATFNSSYKTSALWLAPNLTIHLKILGWRHLVAQQALTRSVSAEDRAVPAINCNKHRTSDFLRKGKLQPKANGYCCSRYRVFVDRNHRYVHTRLYGITLHSHSRLNLKSRTLYCLFQTIPNSIATQILTHAVPAAAHSHQATVRHAGPSVSQNPTFLSLLNPVINEQCVDIRVCAT